MIKSYMSVVGRMIFNLGGYQFGNNRYLCILLVRNLV